MAPPSNLPNAHRLMSKVFAVFAPDYNGYFRSTDLRPEVLFQIISRYENKRLFLIIDKILRTGSFNQNHVFASWLLAQKNNVITTNFDVLVEKACEQNKTAFTKILETSSRKTITPPVLFKIHGSIEDITSLTLTINQVGKALGSTASAIVDQLLDNTVVLVIGYSGLDQLDIMPILQNAPYKKVIWINHDSACLEPLKCKAPNEYIEALERTICYSLNTDSLVNALAPKITKGHPFNPTIKSLRVSRKIQLSIVADYLMHTNRYKELINLEKTSLLTSLHLRVAAFRARRSLQLKYDETNNQRTKLLKDIFRLSPISRRNYYPFIAQYAENERDIEKIFQELKALTISEINESDAEAMLEVAFLLCRYHKFFKAQIILNRTYKYALLHGNILVEARTHILFSALSYYLYDFHKRKPATYRTNILNSGIVHADRAIFLLKSDLLGDDFYLAQAKNNKALLLAHKKMYKKSITLYEEVAKFYGNEKNVGHNVSTLNNIAALYLRQKNYPKALSVINAAIQKNSNTHRGFRSGELYRLKARILLEMPKRHAKMNLRISKIATLLSMAIADFGDNEKEIRDTKVDISRLNRLINSIHI